MLVISSKLFQKTWNNHCFFSKNSALLRYSPLLNIRQSQVQLDVSNPPIPIIKIEEEIDQQSNWKLMYRFAEFHKAFWKTSGWIILTFFFDCYHYGNASAKRRLSRRSFVLDICEKMGKTQVRCQSNFYDVQFHKWEQSCSTNDSPIESAYHIENENFRSCGHEIAATSIA